MRIRKAAAVFVIATLAACPQPARAAKKDLPDAVIETLTKRFADARIVRTGREREKGVSYYEIELERGKDRIEVEIASDGSIGEIETTLDMDGLPDAEKARIREAADGAEIVRVEKHVRIGRGRKGVFEPLPEPIGFYEITCIENGKKREIKIALRPDEPLPPEEMDEEDEDDADDDPEDDDD